jgi:hypothetical protein
MSNSSYALLHNPTDKRDVALTVSEPVSSQPLPPPNITSGDAMTQRYTQIAIAVALYWYEKRFI